jgi:hypothetical protein
MDYLTGDPKYLHFQALTMWANYIETGCVSLSTESAIKCGRKEEINPLNDDQKRVVARLRDEAGYTLQHGVRA